VRIDIVSVFPRYFENLDESLLGKAQQDGLVQIHTHDLRDWTHDVHRSVDDTPVGGGAGMVMKPAVWAECLDELLGLPPAEEAVSPEQMATSPLSDLPNAAATQATQASTQTAQASPTAVPASASKPIDEEQTDGNPDIDNSDIGDLRADNPDIASRDDNAEDDRDDRPVLLFPEPSAPLFTQKTANELSHRSHLVFGCGRYEGIDARVSQYYAARGVDVREYSIGDYVLNGGEVAVSVMIEAITRLLPGFMGNPESIVDESYTGDPLLEYRQFTRPTLWRGIGVPPVLLSGDHGKVDRFRRDESLARTAAIRPDLVEKLDCHALSKQDRKTLMALGWEVSGDHPRKA
jgi:tRNA (guanine37-N1)-methyltransferase